MTCEMVRDKNFYFLFYECVAKDHGQFESVAAKEDGNGCEAAIWF